LQLAGITTALLMGAFLLAMIRKELRRPKLCRGPEGSVIVVGTSFKREPS
jgi:hypothetical protein